MTLTRFEIHIGVGQDEVRLIYCCVSRCALNHSISSASVMVNHSSPPPPPPPPPPSQPGNCLMTSKTCKSGMLTNQELSELEVCTAAHVGHCHDMISMDV